MERSDAIDDLLAGCAILEGEGLTSAFGHLSVTLEDGSILLTGNTGPGLCRSEEDLITVSSTGEVIDGDPSLRAGELPIHLGLLGLGWSSVARFHGPAVLAWGTLGQPLPATLGMGMFCGAEIPCFNTATTVTTAEQGAALGECATTNPAVILRGFGAATAGRSVAESVARAWLLERNAAATLAAAATGAAPLPYDDAQASPFVAAEGPAAAQISRLWTYLRQRHPSHTRERIPT